MTFRAIKKGLNNKPPSINSHVSCASEPRVQNINTAHSVRSVQGLLQCRIIVQPQTFAKPVHRIHHHNSLLFHHSSKIHETNRSVSEDSLERCATVASRDSNKVYSLSKRKSTLRGVVMRRGRVSTLVHCHRSVIGQRQKRSRELQNRRAVIGRLCKRQMQRRGTETCSRFRLGAVSSDAHDAGFCR